MQKAYYMIELLEDTATPGIAELKVRLDKCFNAGANGFDGRCFFRGRFSAV